MSHFSTFDQFPGFEYCWDISTAWDGVDDVGKHGKVYVTDLDAGEEANYFGEGD